MVSGCAAAGVNEIAPGDVRVTDVRLPAAVEMTVETISVHIDSTVMLWSRQAHIDGPSVVRNAITRIEQALHGSPAAVTIGAGSYRVIPNVGIGGYTDRGTGNVRVSMDSRSPVTLEQLLTSWLPTTLAHELHHSKRILDGPGYGYTLLDAMVTEGSAEAFVRELYPDAPAIPWVRRLSKGDERSAWKLARAKLDDPDDPLLHQRWFFGEGAVPHWAGYKIGYAIASGYLARHGKETAAELAVMPARRIFDGSGYDPG
jgi:hypothetical protein